MPERWKAELTLVLAIYRDGIGFNYLSAKCRQWRIQIWYSIVTWPGVEPITSWP